MCAYWLCMCKHKWGNSNTLILKGLCVRERERWQRLWCQVCFCFRSQWGRTLRKLDGLPDTLLIPPNLPGASTPRPFLFCFPIWTCAEWDKASGNCHILVWTLNSLLLLLQLQLVPLALSFTLLLSLSFSFSVFSLSDQATSPPSTHSLPAQYMQLWIAKQVEKWGFPKRRRLIRNIYSSQSKHSFQISHTEERKRKRDRQKERGKINVNLKTRKALIFH